MLQLATYCDGAGFDAVTMADHTVGFGIRNVECFEAWTVLSAFAMATKNVRLGACASDIHRHHPAVLAQMVMTADHISRGRVFLTVGAGEAMNLDPYGIPWDRPVSKTEEGVKLIRKLWAEAPKRIDYDGQFFRLKKAFLAKCVQSPHPPLWIAGNSPRMMKIAALYGDCWLPYVPVDPQHYQDGLQTVRGFARDAGRDPNTILPGLFNYFVVASTTDEARRLIELPAKIWTLVAAKGYRRLGYDITDEFDIHKFQFSDPDSVNAAVEKAKTLPFDVVEKSGYIWGSPEQCIEQLDRFVKAGVRFFVMPMLVHPKIMISTLQLFAEKVLGYFKNK